MFRQKERERERERERESRVEIGKSNICLSVYSALPSQ